MAASSNLKPDPDWDSTPYSMKSKFPDLGLARVVHKNAEDQWHIPRRGSGVKGIELASLFEYAANVFPSCAFGALLWAV